MAAPRKPKNESTAKPAAQAAQAKAAAQADAVSARLSELEDRIAAIERILGSHLGIATG